MHTNVILTNKRSTHAQSNYTNTKLKAWFRASLLCHPARKWGGPILHPRTTRGTSTLEQSHREYSHLPNVINIDLFQWRNKNLHRHHRSCSRTKHSDDIILTLVTASIAAQGSTNVNNVNNLVAQSNNLHNEELSYRLQVT